MNIYPHIENLLYYAQTHLLLDDLDVIYVRNQLLDELKLDSYEFYEVDYDGIDELGLPDKVLEPIINYAVSKNIITEVESEKFADKIMGIVMMLPSDTVDMFLDMHRKSPAKAFEWFYDYAVKSNYVKSSKIAKNKHWEAKGTKGKIEVSINLARPEKKNSETAKLTKSETANKYPACVICKDNEGISANGMYRRTLRTIPLTLDNENWFWQYSPYAYFNQHGIAVSENHTPMKVNKSTFKKLFDFVDYSPNYFIGCNAALPIVGGSILTHDHFQGGKSLLPMHKAPVLKTVKSSDAPYVKIEVLDWYNSAIRLTFTNKNNLADFAETIRVAWENYTDESVDIIAKTDKGQHNAITPIARKLNDGNYLLDIIFRNNRTSEEYPEGIFHSHPEYFPIKSESIGLIEAMGLFILPGRLDSQLSRIEKFLTKEEKYSESKLDEDLLPLKDIIAKLVKESGSSKLSQIEAQLNIKDEVNRICEGILDNTAVFKKDATGVEAFDKFLASINIK